MITTDLLVVRLVRIKVRYYKVGLELCEKKIAPLVGLMCEPT